MDRREEDQGLSPEALRYLGFQERRKNSQRKFKRAVSDTGGKTRADRAWKGM